MLAINHVDTELIIKYVWSDYRHLDIFFRQNLH